MPSCFASFRSCWQRDSFLFLQPLMPAREGRPADECPTSRTIRTGRTTVHIILLSKVVDYMYFASSLGSVRTRYECTVYSVCVCVFGSRF